MNGHILAFALGLFCGSPSSEAIAASQDLRNLAPTDAIYARYLTTYNLPEKDQAETSKVLRFWVNSLSTRKRFGNALKVAPTLYRVDLRDFNWTKESWETLTKQDPYFRDQWLEPNATAYMKSASGSIGAILRVDWFITHTSQEPHYSAFLGLPKTYEELKVTLAIQEEAVKRLSLNQGGAVLHSIVALNNRQLERYPSIMGYFYLSRDVKTNVGRQNVLGAGDNLTAIQNDAGEFIGSLPNGMQFYYLADAKGKQLEEVDPKIAQDTITAFRSKTVVNARSCVVCHATGLNPFVDVISKLVNASKLKLIDTDKDRTIRLEDFYLSDVGRQLRLDQQAFAAAIKAVNGMDAEANAKAFEKVVHQFLEVPIDAATAASELGLESLEPSMIKTTDGTILGIVAGEKVYRDAWEGSFKEAATLALIGRSGK